MQFHASVVTGLAALITFLAPVLRCQEPPAMLATARYLFVLRGEWLYQFDVDTLAFRNRVRLVDEGRSQTGSDAPLDVAGSAAAEPAPPVPRVVRADSWLSEPQVVGGGGAGGRFAARSGASSAHTPGATADAITAGLDWLARHQDEDGKWDADGFMKHDQPGSEISDGPGNAVHDVGVTGLAMLAMLGNGSTLRSGTYKEPLKMASRWLQEQQQENGLFGSNASHDFIYDHAIATYAMCEAYGLSNYKLLQPSAQKGINYLESHRNPYSVWRYQPRDNDNDTSVTSWCLIACKSGEFFGLDVNPDALRLGLTWLDQVTTPDGRCGYTKAGEGSSRKPGDHATRFPIDKCATLTAAGLFCRFFLGQSPKDQPVMLAAADRLLEKPPVWDEKAGTIDHYYWYYGTYAMYQMGGRYWRQWSKAIVPAISEHQHQEGNLKGSWDPVGVWGEDGGRVYSTALMVLTLESYYRYSRLVR